MADLVRDAPVGRGADDLVEAALARARDAAVAWAGVPVRDRLRAIRRARRAIARDSLAFAAILADRRPAAETLVAEVLPLVAAARFLERQAARLLAPRVLRHGRPLWLMGVRAEIRREPLGVVLVLAPSNYPLFLPGAQLLQALAAGNAVCLKPARGCTAPLQALVARLVEAGVPDAAMQVLDDTVETGAAAARAGFDRIVLTGSADSGRQVLRAAAERLTPCTMELSGNDAVFVLPGADLALAAACIAYGLRLNDGATCIAPRRVFVDRGSAAALEQLLAERIAAQAATSVAPALRGRLAGLLREATAAGARVAGARVAGGAAPHAAPILVADARPGMRLLREEIFAPVVSLVPVDSIGEALRAAADCPYALGASIFGPAREAHLLAARVNAGSVVVNDVIVPTADPRLAFGGRGESGFGVTRGAEGLLEMTALKCVSTRRGRFRPHLAASRPDDARRFARLIALLYGGLPTCYDKPWLRGVFPWRQHLRR